MSDQFNTHMKPVSLEATMMKRIGELNAENARHKAEVERLTNNCDYLDQKLDEELDKSAMLCGQVERLTKAGDAMASSIQFEETLNDSDHIPQSVQRWLAAKEGKQS